MSRAWQPVGRRGEALYTVEEGVLEVVSLYGRKATQLGDHPPPVLARLLLLELVRDAEPPLTDPGA